MICRYEGVKFAYLSDFLASRRYDFIAKIFMSADARMARKLNSGTFDVKQYAEHPPVIHLWTKHIQIYHVWFLQSQQSFKFRKFKLS